ncbi:STAS domain-containing protein [Amycolatopsis sp. A133]|uniref:STAS domain-containing protein n=1 Tax=Amycolatopsis sp. A133 TaxID=3064472 RepID=UPI0027EE5081|nr:STAS domain-containing protein [Amycolatopsis sp. A133]MDQ7811052.1 STAS domain-containing protein [Amycolatopsis sp. A133]
MTTHERLRVAGVDLPAGDRLPAPRAPSDGDFDSRIRWKSPDAVVVEVAGEVDLCTVAGLAALLDEHLRARPGVLRVDLGQVWFFGAAGIRVLLRAQRHAEAAGVHLVVDPGGSRAAVRALELLDRLPVR